MERHLVIIALCSAVLAIVYGRAVIRAKRWEEFPDVEFTFDCTDKSIGFYADMEFDCKIFHMCDTYGRRIPHICPNDTMFNQKFRICDWEYNVNCQDSPDHFYLNDLTYETDSPENA